MLNRPDQIYFGARWLTNKSTATLYILPDGVRQGMYNSRAVWRHLEKVWDLVKISSKKNLEKIWDLAKFSNFFRKIAQVSTYQFQPQSSHQMDEIE